MSQLTYEQIADAIAELPQFDKQRLLRILLDQLGLGDGQRNGKQEDAAPLAEIELPDPRPNDQWLKDHKEEYRGQWVALHNGQLIAHGTDGEAVVKTVHQTNVKMPLILFIEPADALPFAGFWT
jgi:hypothetical protein